MADSDSLYHRLFSHPEMVEALVRELVTPTLAAEVDFSRMERVNVKFHSRRRASRREGDVIWKLPTHVGSDVYLYLLIEFQSRTDPWMAVRTQVYQGLLWEQVIDECKLGVNSRLPPLLLLVLYNGKQRWKAATTVRELVALAPDSALQPWQPEARYYLLETGGFPQEDFAERPNLIALLFCLEQSHAPEKLKALLDSAIGWFRRHEAYARLQGLFAEFIREACARNGLRLPKSSNLLEVQSMLAENLMEWREQMRAEGKAAAKAEGKVEGKAEALITLLTKRFGAVTPSRQKRIQKADLPTLDRWFERAIDASNVSSVFNSPR